ncbi:MAG: cation:proton antiporter [Algicola sp.]|nr:cation:proton antiporter [Algicola sp.]
MDQSIFKELIGMLALAVFFVWLFKRFNLPPILAYLATGLVAGSSITGLVHNPEQFHIVAEMGIVFLLFTLGLEFSIPKLMAMRNLVFGAGSAQVIISISVIMSIAVLLGYNWITALAIGGILALSSTAIVIKQLNESGALHNNRGQLAVSILLFQDIAVVPLLIAIPILAGSSGDAVGFALLMAIFKGAMVFAILLAIGKWILPIVFNEIAKARTEELFVLTTILVTVIASLLTYMFGLSMALGAFLAGMMLGESQYRHQLEADIRPFRDILMGLFFITIGMQLDLVAIYENLLVLLVLLVGVMFIKILIGRLSAWFVSSKPSDGWAVAFMLCQVGEFGFVLIALAIENQVLDQQTATLLIAVGVISMALTPSLVHNSQFFARKIARDDNHHDKETFEQESQLSEHVIICGFGRVGQTISRFLKLEAVPFIALDVDPVRVSEAKAAGENIQFGNARYGEILEAVGVRRAKLVIITFGDYNKTEAVVQKVLKIDPEVKILVRTRSDEHLEKLQVMGVSDVVPESLEGSLMLVSHVLYMTGVPVKRILKRIQLERKNRYGKMHGFYRGEDTDMGPDKIDRLEFLHAILLSDGASAIGKTLLELGLDDRRIILTGLRRDGVEMSDPAPDTVLISQDILIVRGKPRQVERVEQFLLGG